MNKLLAVILIVLVIGLYVMMSPSKSAGFGDACDKDTPCDHGVCVHESRGGMGRCTRWCDPLKPACPARYTCEPTNDVRDGLESAGGYACIKH